MFGVGSAYAQFLPPPVVTKWDSQTNGNWATANNWEGNAVPSSGADVFFGSVPGGPANPDQPTTNVTNSANRSQKSLWFDAALGIWYTIRGSGRLTLGGGLGSNEVVIGVASNLQSVTENNIEVPIILDNAIAGRSLWIVNDSLGGLRLGGTLNIGSQNLIVSNTQKPLARSAVHLNGAITGTGNITTVNGATQHLVLQANNLGWSGGLNVGAQTLVFVKSDGALGTGANIVANGGTLGFRSHVGTTLNYTSTTQPLQVSGAGAVRTWGQPGVGALYHDGGNNVFTGDIQMVSSYWYEPTYFGARGDQGSLTLTGKVSGGSDSTLYKVGHGLITLTNPNNKWARTYIQGGVLRIPNANALGGASVGFRGGLLELAGSQTHWTFNYGSVPGNNVFWNNQYSLPWQSLGGGFSASGGDKTVTLFKSGSTLLQASDLYVIRLSSRYADSRITLDNDFVSDSPAVTYHFMTRVVVERGVSEKAYAVITGPPPNVMKYGAGLLELEGFHATHWGHHNIYEGALITQDLSLSGSINFHGGVLGTRLDITQDVSAYVNQIHFNLSGGFAAYGNADRTVRLNNSTALINWGASTFVKTGYELMFGHYTSDGTILWDKQIGLGTNQARVINVERGIPAAAANRADVSFMQALSGTGGSLTIKGDGRMDIAVDNPDLKLATINIFGAELRLQQGGKIANEAIDFVLKNGGTLTLDNAGTHHTTTGGLNLPNRIDEQSTISLKAGNLRFWGSGVSAQGVGSLSLEDGANIIDVRKGGGQSGEIAILASMELSHAPSSVATLDLLLPGFDRISGFVLATWNAAHDINDYGSSTIVPWATVNGADWATPQPYYSTPLLTHLIALQNYHTDPQDTWDERWNIYMEEVDDILTTTRTINSLKMEGASLGLHNNNLVISSGGLLTLRDNGITGKAIVKTEQGRPLYIHTNLGGLTFSDSVAVVAPDLVKTGQGTLWLNSDVDHQMAALYIHQGTVDLQQGWISAGEIVIGDGAGKDIFILPGNRWNPLKNSPNITLRGTPYGPGAEYASYNPDEAILRMGGNTKQYISTLYIEDRGTIDWVGGEVGKANILFVDKLEFNNADARLFMRNWYEYEDYLLVKKNGFNFNNLSQIVFDGLWDLPALAVSYDANYYMITTYNSPEPETYGAILGAVGIVLWTWRRHKRRGPNRALAK